MLGVVTRKSLALMFLQHMVLVQASDKQRQQKLSHISNEWLRLGDVVTLSGVKINVSPCERTNRSPYKII